MQIDFCSNKHKQGTHTHNERHVKHSELIKSELFYALICSRTFFAGFHHLIVTDKIGHYQV